MIRNEKKKQVIIRSLQHLLEHCEVEEFSVYNHPVMTVLTDIFWVNQATTNLILRQEECSAKHSNSPFHQAEFILSASPSKYRCWYRCFSPPQAPHTKWLSAPWRWSMNVHWIELSWTGLYTWRNSKTGTPDIKNVTCSKTSLVFLVFNISFKYLIRSTFSTLSNKYFWKSRNYTAGVISLHKLI